MRSCIAGPVASKGWVDGARHRQRSKIGPFFGRSRNDRHAAGCDPEQRRAAQCKILYHVGCVSALKGAGMTSLRCGRIPQRAADFGRHGAAEERVPQRLAARDDAWSVTTSLASKPVKTSRRRAILQAKRPSLSANANLLTCQSTLKQDGSRLRLCWYEYFASSSCFRSRVDSIWPVLWRHQPVHL